MAFKVSAKETDEVEMLYSIDELRLSLYVEADQKSKVYQYLTSGEKLKVMEKPGQYVLVVTKNGKKSWVKHGF